MLLRSITKHVKDQNWFAVFLDFVIVVFGVYCGVWISGYQQQQVTLDKQRLVVESLRQDLVHVGSLDVEFRAQIDQGLARWKAERSTGAIIPPFYFRIPGSDTPPQTIWNSIQQSQLTDLFAPDLLNDLGFYYSELNGIGVKYIRYITFVENEILPGLKETPSYFYESDGSRLKAKYAASMDRLRDWSDENKRLTVWSDCLAVRLETPMESGVSCIPDLTLPMTTP